MPSERLTCVVRLAGAAPRPVSTFALEKRPSSGRGRFSVSADCGAGIRLGVSRTLVMPALGAGIHDLLIDRLVVGQFESRSPPYQKRKTKLARPAGLDGSARFLKI